MNFSAEFRQRFSLAMSIPEIIANCKKMFAEMEAEPGLSPAELLKKEAERRKNIAKEDFERSLRTLHLVGITHMSVLS